MARAGFCAECGRNVWLKLPLCTECENGHPLSALSGFYDADYEVVVVPGRPIPDTLGGPFQPPEGVAEIRVMAAGLSPEWLDYGRQNDPRSLVSLIRDAEGSQRNRLVASLVARGDAAAAGALLEVIGNDSHTGWDVPAVYGLAAMGPIVVPALIVALGRSSDDWAGWRARDALGWIGAPAVPALWEVIRKSRDDVAKGRAVEALAYTGLPEVVPGLLELLKAPDDMGAPVYIATSFGEYGLRALINTVASPTSAREAYRALLGLAYLWDQTGMPGDSRAVSPGFRALFRFADSGGMRDKLARALALYGDRAYAEALAYLPEIAKHANPEYASRRGLQANDWWIAACLVFVALGDEYLQRLFDDTAGSPQFANVVMAVKALVPYRSLME